MREIVRVMNLCASFTSTIPGSVALGLNRERVQEIASIVEEKIGEVIREEGGCLLALRVACRNPEGPLLLSGILNLNALKVAIRGESGSEDMCVLVYKLENSEVKCSEYEMSLRLDEAGEITNARERIIYLDCWAVELETRLHIGTLLRGRYPLCAGCFKLSFSNNDYLMKRHLRGIAL